MKQIYEQLQSKGVYLQRLCVVSRWENLNHIHDQEKFGNRRESHNSSHPCSSEGFSQDTPQLSSRKKSTKIIGDEIKVSFPLPGSQHLFVDVQRH